MCVCVLFVFLFVCFAFLSKFGTIMKIKKEGRVFYIIEFYKFGVL